ncbi:hypothetical protein [Microbacterium maritypicum]|uniref:hypothetical protein n=1 Tax=Microbacterium maritypicum TaxID=33918 RepID=UPI00381EB7A9
MTDIEKLNDPVPAVRLRARIEEALRIGNNNYGWIEVEAGDLRELLAAAFLTPTEDQREDASPELRARLRSLVSDWQANAASRELGDPTASTWNDCARQLWDALNGERS